MRSSWPAPSRGRFFLDSGDSGDSGFRVPGQGSGAGSEIAERRPHPSPGTAGLPRAFGPVPATGSTVGGRLRANRPGHPSPGTAGLPQAFDPAPAMNSTVGGRLSARTGSATVRPQAASNRQAAAKRLRSCIQGWRPDLRRKSNRPPTPPPRQAADSITSGNPSKYPRVRRTCSAASSTRLIDCRNASRPGCALTYQPRCLRAIRTPRSAP